MKPLSSSTGLYGLFILFFACITTGMAQTADRKEWFPAYRKAKALPAGVSLPELFSESRSKQSAQYTGKIPVNPPQFENPTPGSLIDLLLDSEDGAVVNEFYQGPVYGFTFDDNGSRLYIPILGIEEFGAIAEYGMDSPFAVDTALENFLLESDESLEISATDMEFSTDGSLLFTVGPFDPFGRVYPLGTPFDLESVEGVFEFEYGDLDLVDQTMSAMTFSEDGMRMYVGRAYSAAEGEDRVFQFNLENPFDPTSIVSTTSLNLADSGAVLDITFSINGKKMYVVTSDFGLNTLVYEFDLEAPYEMDSALAIPVPDVLEEEDVIITDINFSADGSMVFFQILVGLMEGDIFSVIGGIPVKSNIAYPENSTLLITDLDANDGDGGATDENVTYTLGSGGDSVLFAIDPVTGELSFSNPPDFENPLDGDANNIYEVEVIATDAEGSTSLPILITVTDEDDTPPAGYAVSIDQELIDPSNETSVSFSYTGAEVGATYDYAFTSDGGGEAVVGTGVIESQDGQFTGIDLSGLENGTVSLSFSLTDEAGNQGVEANATTVKNTLVDTDGDGIGDDEDNCAEQANADQLDTDEDGQGDVCDTDDDNDGTPDEQDAFPLDPEEDADADEDGTGDNADTDDDNDGTPDEQDAFPLDPEEDSDTDGDGTGDNADPDDDNDGQSDEDEILCGSDPTDDTSTSPDTDGDASPDCLDEDDDNDGIPDLDDAFPLDDTEEVDTDGDGTGDNADTDDDNDGQSDAAETECGSNPLNAESTAADTDGDGIPNCVDTDDDNDGVADQEDAFPTQSEPRLRPAEAFTPNGDGNNDRWVIPGLNNYPNNMVMVYNRSGHVVFEARGYQNDWEGFYRDNRERLPQGSYLYVIDLGDDNPPKQGWIYINY